MSMNNTQPRSTETAGPHHQELMWIAEAVKDLSKFRPLYEAFYNEVYIFTYRRCAHEQDCRDIVSKVFEKAMLNLAKYSYKGYSFTTWLYRIASNEIADYFKKRNHEEKLWVRDDGLPEFMAEMQEDSADEQMIVKILEVISTLERSERELITMRFFEKRPYAEIAVIQQQSENYLRVKMTRVLKKIKDLAGGRQ